MYVNVYRNTEGQMLFWAQEVPQPANGTLLGSVFLELLVVSDYPIVTDPTPPEGVV